MLERSQALLRLVALRTQLAEFDDWLASIENLKGDLSEEEFGMLESLDINETLGEVCGAIGALMPANGWGPSPDPSVQFDAKIVKPEEPQ